MWGGTEASVIRFVRPTDPALLFFFAPPHFAAPRPIFFALYVVYVDMAKCVTLYSGEKIANHPSPRLQTLFCYARRNQINASLVYRCTKV